MPKSQRKQQLDLGKTVWVRHGKAASIAFLVQDAKSRPGEVCIQWQNRGDREYVPQEQIQGDVILAEEGRSRRSSRRRTTYTEVQEEGEEDEESQSYNSKNKNKEASPPPPPPPPPPNQPSRSTSNPSSASLPQSQPKRTKVPARKQSPPPTTRPSPPPKRDSKKKARTTEKTKSSTAFQSSRNPPAAVTITDDCDSISVLSENSIFAPPPAFTGKKSGSRAKPPKKRRGSPIKKEKRRLKGRRNGKERVTFGTRRVTLDKETLRKGCDPFAFCDSPQGLRPKVTVVTDTKPAIEAPEEQQRHASTPRRQAVSDKQLPKKVTVAKKKKTKTDPKRPFAEKSQDSISSDESEQVKKKGLSQQESKLSDEVVSEPEEEMDSAGRKEGLKRKRDSGDCDSSFNQCDSVQEKTETKKLKRATQPPENPLQAGSDVSTGDEKSETSLSSTKTQFVPFTQEQQPFPRGPTQHSEDEDASGDEKSNTSFSATKPARRDVPDVQEREPPESPQSDDDDYEDDGDSSALAATKQEHDNPIDETPKPSQNPVEDSDDESHSAVSTTRKDPTHADSVKAETADAKSPGAGKNTNKPTEFERAACAKQVSKTESIRIGASTQIKEASKAVQASSALKKPSPAISTSREQTAKESPSQAEVPTHGSTSTGTPEEKRKTQASEEVSGVGQETTAGTNSTAAASESATTSTQNTVFLLLEEWKRTEQGNSGVVGGEDELDVTGAGVPYLKMSCILSEPSEPVQNNYVSSKTNGITTKTASRSSTEPEAAFETDSVASRTSLPSLANQVGTSESVPETKKEPFQEASQGSQPSEAPDTTPKNTRKGVPTPTMMTEATTKPQTTEQREKPSKALLLPVNPTLEVVGMPPKDSKDNPRDSAAHGSRLTKQLEPEPHDVVHADSVERARGLEMTSPTKENAAPAQHAKIAHMKHIAATQASQPKDREAKNVLVQRLSMKHFAKSTEEKITKPMMQKHHRAQFPRPLHSSKAALQFRPAHHPKRTANDVFSKARSIFMASEATRVIDAIIQTECHFRTVLSPLERRELREYLVELENGRCKPYSFANGSYNCWEALSDLSENEDEEESDSIIEVWGTYSD